MNPTQVFQYEQYILQQLTGLVGEYAGEVGAVTLAETCLVWLEEEI